jgi:hypothetical protein
VGSGKQTAINAKANKKLKELYENTDIRSCELQLNECQGPYMLTYAHRHKRIWYYPKPELLWDFKQSVLACMNCHQIIEKDRKLTAELFMKLRGEEDVC